MNHLEKLIEDIALRLPELPPLPRKNLFDILGVRDKETINSRILAYFLDKEEDHGFGSLFFDVLLNIYSSKCGLNIENFGGDYSVGTEETTSMVLNEADKQKSIDISLDGDDWSVIIENKLYHHLNNPLDVYWKHKKRCTDNVIGIILSLNALNESDCVAKNGARFVNITHSELIEAVQQDLVLGNKLSTTSLMYLQEYIKTIQTHYSQQKDETIMNDILQAIINQRDHLKQIQKKTKEAADFVDKQIEEVFLERGYIKKKQWYHDERFPGLFFWISSGENFIKNNSIKITFEARNKVNELITEAGIVNHFSKTKIPHISFGNEHGGKWQTHIARYNNSDFLYPDDSFKEKFARVIDEIYLQPGHIQDETVNYLNMAINYQELIPKETEVDE
jgi:hypothetical protein